MTQPTPSRTRSKGQTVSDQVLYKANPDELIEYSHLIEIRSGQTSGAQRSETHHDVIAVVSGTGLLWIGDEKRSLTFGQPVVLPHSATYELEPDSEQDLQVMIFGIAPLPRNIQEGE